tara:strand:- start:1613 stop:1783 length:171 start_codon:yes stop_codon:yes gene_type:complete
LEGNSWITSLVGSSFITSLFIPIEGLHLAEHGKNCKTKAAWMNEVVLEDDRESEVH